MATSSPAGRARKPAILLIDDEAPMRFSLSALLDANGFSNVLSTGEPREAMAMVASRRVGVIVLDLCMPTVSGQDLLQSFAGEYPEIPVVVLTAVDDIQVAVSCMREGAFHYLVKPLESEMFVTTIRNAEEVFLLREEVASLKRVIVDGGDASLPGISTRSPKMGRLFAYARSVAPSFQPVLITGETGVGKELVARAVHELSGVKGEFVPVNVAGLDDSVFSDTIFGHRRGAFTGAEAERPGLLARAQSGTLFLDEIGDLSPATQVKLLRLLQGGEYYPIGSDMPRKSDARIVLATHRDLAAEVREGRFRKDLYYRIFIHHLQIPPLRERKEDIPFLLGRFVEEAAAKMGRPVPAVPPELITLLRPHSFPGNVRELEGMVYDAVACAGRSLSLEPFRRHMAPGGDTEKKEGLVSPDFIPTLKEAEEYLIAEALRQAEGNQGIAAAILGISRQALNRRLSRARSGGATWG